MMIPLQAVTPGFLVDRVGGLSIKEARKIVGAVHRISPTPGGTLDHGLPPSLPGVRRTSLEAVRAVCAVPQLEIRAERRSSLDPFVKFALKAADGSIIETVRIPLERAGRFSVCVSSQVGCALGCLFCATGRMGLQRNLAAWEIVEQVRVVRRTLVAAGGQRVHGVVFQGMGEPLANLDQVIDAIRVLCEPCALAIDARAITVCTAGLPSGIRRLAREAPKVRLGLSIASARPQVRRNLMPIEDSHPLEEVLDAAAEHARITRLAPMWSVTPLSGVNDTDEDSQALVRLAHSFAAKAGLLPRISVVPYNPIDEPSRDPFARSDLERESLFRGVLHAAGISSHKRYSGGMDVNAACGQLAGKM